MRFARTGPARALMAWGPVAEFEVYPLNYHEMDHQTGTDWARKEIAGAPIHREYVGENDEEIFLRGSVFPFKFGGLDRLEVMEAARRAGQIHQLVRGDGRILGWFVCEKLVRGHKFISGDGVGQRIDFEASFARMPVPDPAAYFPELYQMVA